MAVRAQSHTLHGFKLSSQCSKIYSPALRLGASRVCQNVLPKISCSMNMTAGQSGEPDRINLEVIRDKARKVWESCPEPVTTFPWTRTFENFVQLIADLTLTVITYLSVPLLAVSSLSEMSYCAHERRLFLVPFPLLVGAAVAGAFREAALEASPLLKDEAKSSNARKIGVRASAFSTSPGLQFVKTKIEVPEKTARIGVLGASGYTGSEIVRLLANHPYFGITVMTADRKAGQSIGSVFPHLATQHLPDLIAIKDADFSDVDAVFCCLPHGTTQEIIKPLPNGLKIVDLSADFRLRDIGDYEKWYGQPHRAPELQKEAVYGLTEIYRKEIQDARLVANPGCYPTSIQLPLVPLIKANLIKSKNIIIDAKSGVSGAGRGAKEANLYTEIAEGIHSYGITAHRHVPEIEQGLCEAADGEVIVSFTPHLMPMSRGMQSTIYVEMAPGVTVEDLYQQLKISYENEEFVVLLREKEIPHTRHVRGSNYCLVNVFPDRIPGRAIIVSVVWFHHPSFF